jgi:hypothetical protein
MGMDWKPNKEKWNVTLRIFLKAEYEFFILFCNELNIDTMIGA